MRKAINFDIDTKKYEEYIGKQYSLVDTINKTIVKDFNDMEI